MTPRGKTIGLKHTFWRLGVHIQNDESAAAGSRLLHLAPRLTTL